MSKTNTFKDLGTKLDNRLSEFQNGLRDAEGGLKTFGENAEKEISKIQQDTKQLVKDIEEGRGDERARDAVSQLGQQIENLGRELRNQTGKGSEQLKQTQQKLEEDLNEMKSALNKRNN
mgnify:CR=1 FL=1